MADQINFFVITHKITYVSRDSMDDGYPDDGGSKHLWNVDLYLADYMAHQQKTAFVINNRVQTQFLMRGADMLFALWISAFILLKWKEETS